MSTETIGTIILLASFFIMIFAGNHIIFSIGISTLLTLLYLKVPLIFFLILIVVWIGKLLLQQMHNVKLYKYLGYR